MHTHAHTRTHSHTRTHLERLILVYRDKEILDDENVLHSIEKEENNLPEKWNQG
jgi:hypothetical protein